MTLSDDRIKCNTLNYAHARHTDNYIGKHFELLSVEKEAEVLENVK